MKSTDGLLTAGSPPKSAASKRSLMQAKRSSWFSFKQTGSSASTELEPQHRLSTEIHRLSTEIHLDGGHHPIGVRA